MEEMARVGFLAIRPGHFLGMAGWTRLTKNLDIRPSLLVMPRLLVPHLAFLDLIGNPQIRARSGNYPFSWARGTGRKGRRAVIKGPASGDKTPEAGCTVFTPSGRGADGR